MKIRVLVLATSALLITVAGCLQPTDVITPPPTETSNNVVGPSGGSVRAGGASLQIPEGAVQKDVTFTIEESAVTLPSTMRAESPVFLLGPEGQHFERSVRIAIRPTQTANASMRIATAPRGSQAFELLETRLEAGELVSDVNHFSLFAVVTPQAEVDAGTEGVDAGDPLDAGSAPEFADAATPDAAAAIDAGSCAQKDDAGVSTCPFYGIAQAPNACSSKSACQGGRWLDCTGTTCTCTWAIGNGQNLTRTVTVGSDVCTEAGFRRTWSCECGFPPLQ